MTEPTKEQVDEARRRVKALAELNMVPDSDDGQDWTPERDAITLLAALEAAESRADAAYNHCKIALDRLAAAREAMDEAIAERDELQDLFDLQHTRTEKADELWRQAHPSDTFIIPDLGKLIDWLLEQRTVPRVMLNEIAHHYHLSGGNDNYSAIAAKYGYKVEDSHD